MRGYAEWHKHGQFSTLDGTGDEVQYAERAVELGYPYLNLTDHGTLGGALHHIKACREVGIMPMVGMEAFFKLDRNYKSKDWEEDGHWRREYHLTLTANSNEGFRNLMRLSSVGWIEGFYHKPCVDIETLEKYSDGIIATSACIYSYLSQALINGDEAAAKNFADWCMKTFDGRFWIEIMPHDWDEQRNLNILLVNFAQKYGYPLLATNDVHYPYKEWADTQKIVMMCSTGQSNLKAKAKREANEQVYGEGNVGTLYLMNGDQMFDSFKSYHPEIPDFIVDEAIANSLEIVKTGKMYVVPRDTKFPKVSESPAHSEKMLNDWIEAGLRAHMQRWRDIGKNEIWCMERESVYRERLEYEMGVLKGNGVLDYFVLVGDLIRWAKSDKPLPQRDENGNLFYPEGETKRPIRVGLGRGSAAGALVSFFIGITNIDPIGYGLLFERFLNPARKGLPDIDIDFDSDYRDLVKQYLKVVYGEDHVADVIARSTFAARAAIGEIGRVFDDQIEYTKLKGITDSITDKEASEPLEKLAKHNEKILWLKEKHPIPWEHMLRLEGQISRDSKHASAVLITPKPVSEYMPLQVNKKDESIVTAWSDTASFPIISDFGFVKLDVLATEGLTKQDITLMLIEQNGKEVPDIDHLPALYDPELYDSKVMEVFLHGMTLGIFQFGSRGITQLLRQMHADAVGDVVAANALYRPGAMKEAFKYGDRKKGAEFEYWHPGVVEMLGETWGLIAYQEQVMEICKGLGNFSPAQADDMRKAVSKLYRLPGDEAREFMQKFYDQWQKGCLENGLTQEALDTIWQNILEFAGYGFNKSHSASYALQAYQDAFLKTYFPLEFYAALLTREPELAEQAVREARNFDVEITQPDINESGIHFTIKGNQIMYGLAAVRECGTAAAQDIIQEREANGPYTSFEDFLRRLPSLSIAVSKMLVAAGAFDNVGEDREALLSQVVKHDKHLIVWGCGHKKYVFEGEAEADKIGLAGCQKKGCLDDNDAAMDVETFEHKYEEWTMAEAMKANTKLKKPKEIPHPVSAPTPGEISGMEKVALGVGLSTANVVADNAPVLRDFIYSEEEIDELPNVEDLPKGRKSDAACQVGGEVIATKVIELKKGKYMGQEMAFVDLAFERNQYSCTLFVDQYRQYKSLLESSSALMVSGKKNNRGSITVDFMQDINDFVVQAQEA